MKVIQQQRGDIFVLRKELLKTAYPKKVSQSSILESRGA